MRVILMCAFGVKGVINFRVLASINFILSVGWCLAIMRLPTLAIGSVHMRRPPRLTITHPAGSCPRNLLGLLG